MNQIVEDMLRSYCMREPTKWTRYLYLVEFAYNASHQRSIGMSPFKALYGQECLTPLKWTDPMFDTSQVDRSNDQGPSFKRDAR